jgi:PAS domain S-box-containing protein
MEFNLIVGFLQFVQQDYPTFSLRESRLLKKFCNGALDAIVLSDHQGIVVYANQAYFDLCGYPPNQIIGQPFSVIYSKSYKKEAESVYQALFGEKSRESTQNRNQVLATIQKPDQTIQYVHVNYSYITKRRKKVALASVMRPATGQILMQRRKDAFVDIARHELKNQLASFKGFIGLLAKYINAKSPDDRKFDEYINQLNLTVEKLEYLVADLLGETEAGTLNEFSLRAFDFDELADECVGKSQFLFPDHQISLNGKTRKYLVADRSKINQAIMTLLDNAVKFSPPKSKVIVTIQNWLPNGHDRIRLSVTDYGVGIPKTQMAKIFSLHYMGVTNQPKLSLFRSQRIIKEHGGTFEVQSELERGSTFSFTLPIYEEPKWS